MVGFATSRRHVLGAALVAGGAGALTGCTPDPQGPPGPQTAPFSGPAPGKGTHLVMLGTQGGPIPGARAATATALVVDGAVYLVDAGSGLPLRFSESGLDFAAVRGMFITHLHSDHCIDAFNFFSLNWTNWDVGNQLVQVHGPGRAGANGPRASPSPGLPQQPFAELVAPDLATPGIEDFFALSIKANAYDINERLRSTRRVDRGPMDLTGRSSDPMMRVHDIAAPAVANVGDASPAIPPIDVYEDDRIKVTATLVDHPPVFPAFGFRFDTPHGSVVFSGDTTPCDNLRSLAHGADVLVNEVMDIDAATAKFRGQPLYDTMARQFAGAHTPAAEWTSPTGENKPGVGGFARSCNVRALVLNHIYPGDGSVTDDAFQASAEREFRRPVVVSHDLLVLDIAQLRKS